MNDEQTRKEEASWPLHEAASDGNVEAVRRLLSDGFDVNAFDDCGNTPLHYAAQGEHLGVASILLDHGADVNIRHEPTVGNSPLRAVASSCSLAMAAVLVRAGADPNLPGWTQITALHKAANRKRGDGPDVYRLLRTAAEKSSRRI